MVPDIGRWINERWPLSDLVRLGLEEDIPGGSSYAYVFGSLLLFTFFIQAVTGIWQLFYYVPTVPNAYDSLSYLRTEIPFGWLIHGLHYWGANAMVVILVCHVIRVFTWGAYKSPRELTWLTGTLLLLTVLAMSFTGAPLPWDERGYWATEVGTSIAGTVPYFGELTKQLIRGGETMGQLTLSRMFIMHAAILPATLVGIVGIHLVAFRRFGSSGPWNEKRSLTTGPFWPDQLFKDLFACSLLFLVLIALAVYFPPPFAGPADPLDTTYTPKPEWNFLFLYEALKFFPGKFEVVGTIGVPTLGILILVMIPFVDRRSERNPARRPVAIALCALSVIILILLTIAGNSSNPGTDEGKTKPVSAASSMQPKGSLPGQALFLSQGCTGCHKVNGSGGSIGPDLSGEGGKGRSREWLTTQIRNPKAHDPGTAMPAFTSLTDLQAGQLADYLLSLNGRPGPGGALKPASVATAARTSGLSAVKVPGKAAFIIGSSEHGALLFEKNCAPCHGPAGAGHVPDPGSAAGVVPSLNPINSRLYSRDSRLFASNTDMIIQHGARPAGIKPAIKMPAFGATRTLSQEEISDIEAYVLELNGVDRGEILHPGMRPQRFFLVAAVAFLFICFIALGAYGVGKN